MMIVFKLKYIMKSIKPIVKQSIELTMEANKEYNKKIQARFIDSVFTLCGSWYRLNLHKDGNFPWLVFFFSPSKQFI